MSASRASGDGVCRPTATSQTVDGRDGRDGRDGAIVTRYDDKYGNFIPAENLPTK
jgi:hypothetical protein